MSEIVKVHRKTHFLGDISRLIAEDFRHLQWPILGWWSFLAAVGWSFAQDIDAMELTDDYPARLFFFVSFLGPVLSGLLVLRHRLGRRAWWRTRPWPRHLVLVAKLVGIAIFVWLPAALVQLALIAKLDFVEPMWALHTVELVLTPGAWMLAGAAVACLCDSLAAFLTSFLVAAQVLGLVHSGLYRVYQNRGEMFTTLELILVLMAALLVLALTYASVPRLKALAVAGLVLLGVFPAYSVDWPVGFRPGLAVEIGAISGPASPGVPRARSGSSSLCIDFELTGVSGSADGDVRNDVKNEVEFVFRGFDQRLAAEIHPFSAIDAKRTGPDSARGESEHFAYLPSALLASNLHTRGDLELILTPFWRRRVLDETPLRPVFRLEGRSSEGESFTYHATALDFGSRADTQHLKIDRGPRFSHLIQPPRAVVAIAFEHLPPGATVGWTGASGGPVPILPFGAAQYTRRQAENPILELASRPEPWGPQAVAAAADPATAFAQTRVLLVEHGQAASGSVVATLKDVALGELVCP